MLLTPLFWQNCAMYFPFVKIIGIVGTPDSLLTNPPQLRRRSGGFWGDPVLYGRSKIRELVVSVKTTTRGKVHGHCHCIAF